MRKVIRQIGPVYLCNAKVWLSRLVVAACHYMIVSALWRLLSPCKHYCNVTTDIDWLINQLECFVRHLRLMLYWIIIWDRNTLLLRLISGYLYSVCPKRQFHTLPGVLSSCTDKLIYPKGFVPSGEGEKSLYHFIMLFDPASMPSLSHDLPHEANTLTTKPSRRNRGMNPRPTVWEAGTLTTKPSRRSPPILIWAVSDSTQKQK